MKRYAVIYSCEEYKEYNDIPFCHSDACLIYDTLKNYCDYCEDNLTLSLLYKGDEDINPQRVYEELIKVTEIADEEDTILFYFAGHGKKVSEKGYLILPDTQDNNLLDTALDLAQINEILSSKKCSSFVILDACHSGILPRGEETPLFIERIADKSCVTLASCSENEYSYSDSTKEQGIFTYYLSDAIKKSPLNEPIMLEGLKQEVCRRVQEWCEKNYKCQTPTIVGTIVGNTFIATRNSKPVESGIIPQVVQSEKEESKMENKLQEVIIPVNVMHSPPTLWQSNTGVSLPKIFCLEDILSYDCQLKSREQEMIIKTYKAGYFEMASETIWNRAITILRKRVLALGHQFVSEMVGVENLDYIRNLPVFEVINLAFELGFIDGTGKMRLMHANEIVQHYYERDVVDEMPQNESDSVIRPCVQYILGYEDANIQIEYTDFRTSLITENFASNPIKLEALNTSPYFYKKTTIRTLVNLLSTTESAEFETVEANFCTIIKKIWGGLTSDDRYFIGLTFSRHKNSGDKRLVAAFNKALMSVNGFDYVPETLRSLSFIENAKKLKEVHYAFDNFYNEPSAVNRLNKMGTKIPRPAIKECIGATLMVLLGNSYGISFNAIAPAKEILSKLSSEDWGYYVEHCLIKDEEVLSKIEAGGARVERWCSIAEEFALQNYDYTSAKIGDFIKYSVNKDYSNAKACAIAFKKSLYS